MKNNVFVEAPDDQAPLCRVKYDGCTNLAMVRIPCRREGTECYACSSCMRTWRARCLLDPSLGSRCPSCAAHEVPQARDAALAAALPPPLHGAAAVAISEALRLEGVTADIRARVLIRLRRDLAPWLEGFHPDSEWRTPVPPEPVVTAWGSGA
jgi:hypothetical protein